MRCLGVAPDAPNDIMCSAMALAPADVPATAAPRRCAARMARAILVPETMEASRSWFPPVRKTPVAPFSDAASFALLASRRVSGRNPTTFVAPRRRNTCR